MITTIESEESVVGGLMIDPVVDKVLATGLQSSDFSNQTLGKVFDEIVGMHNDKQKIDILTVKNHTKGKGIDFNYLASIADSTPTVSNIGVYAKHIRSTSLKSRIEGLKRSITYDNFNKVSAEIAYLQEELESSDETSMKSVVAKTIDYMEEIAEGRTGIYSGFRALDYQTNGFKAGTLTVIAARPAMGKSTFVLNIASHIADENNVLFFSLEMKQEDLAMKMASAESNVPLPNVYKNKMSDREQDRYYKALADIGNKKLNIVDKSGLSVQDIINYSRKVASTERGLDMIVIDYLQIMKYDKGREISELGTITRELRGFAKELGVPVLLLFQLSRGVEKRDNKEPQMSDLRSSGEIEQDADIILMLYRDDYYTKELSTRPGIAEVHIVKNRMGGSGMHIQLNFKGEISKFSDMEIVL
jgi:replicative DNA helicase